jgi:hypothetical protein
MKKSVLFILIAILTLVVVSKNNSYAQTRPVMYFCEKYDDVKGEVGQSSTFSTGRLTVMVKWGEPLNLTNCAVQLDKYSLSTEKFTFYKKVNFTLTRDMKYVFFRSDELSFDERGVYRVYLLDETGETVTASVIIVRGY